MVTMTTGSECKYLLFLSWSPGDYGRRGTHGSHYSKKNYNPLSTLAYYEHFILKICIEGCNNPHENSYDSEIWLSVWGFNVVVHNMFNFSWWRGLVVGSFLRDSVDMMVMMMMMNE